MNRRHALRMLVAFAAAAARAQQPGKGLVIVLIGPPGSGSAAQAGLLRKRLRVPAVEAGKLKIPPGGIIEDAVDQRLRQPDAAGGFVLDGYPRTRDQAARLNRIAAALNLSPPIVVQLDMPDDVARERVRKETRGRMGAFEEQLAAYKAEFAALRELYSEASIWTVNATRHPEQIADTIEMLLRGRR